MEKPAIQCKQIPSRIKQSGISLLEVLLSLSIIAVILVMATRYFFVASNNEKINTARQQIGEVVAAVHSWKSENPTYDGVNINELYSEGFLTKSSNLKTTPTVALYNPWGNSTYNLTSTTEQAEVAMTLPTSADCNSLAKTYPNGGSCSGAQFNLIIK